MKTKIGILIFSFFLYADLFAYQDGSRIAWDYTTGKYVTNGVYSRVKRLNTGELALVYSDGPNVYIRKSSDNGGTWSGQVLVASQASYNNTNADMIQLSNGWLLYAWNGRPVTDGTVPYIIKTKLSKDNGATWVNEQLIYTADVVAANGCWEPALIQLPSGEIQLFFSNENPYRNSNDQEIDMVRSYDNAATWSGIVVTSHRSGGRDGMPIPLYLKNNSNLVYSIEDPGYNGTFKPVIISSSVQSDWNGGTVPGNSPNRWGALRSDYALPASVYAGAPYLIQMANGETVISCQSEQGRNAGNSTMQVYIGDENAQNFSRQNTPFPYLAAAGTANWNAMLALDENTIMATSSINTAGNGPSGIWIITGKIIPPINASIGNITIDGQIKDTEWNTPSSAFIGSYSNTNTTMKTSYDANNLYVLMDVNDQHLWNNSSTLWNDDGIEIYLDPQNKNCNGICTGLYKLLFNIGNNTLFQQCNSQGAWDTWTPSGVNYKIKYSGTINNATDTDQGYVVEVAIPWSQIGGKPSAAWGIHAKLHDNQDGGTVNITHEELSGANANIASTWLRINLNNMPNGQGLTGNYYDGMSFNTFELNRTDANINFDWGNGSPASAVTQDTFSVRWTGYVTPAYSEEYTFYINSDNGRRLWIGDSLVIDKWIDDWGTEYSGKITLAANTKYPIRIDYFEDNGGASINASWSSKSQAKVIIPTSVLTVADSVIRFPYYKVFQVPGLIQAEDFDLGNNGVTYATPDVKNLGGQYRSDVGIGIEKCTDTGGGYDVGWLHNGERIQYSINTLQAGLYTFAFRVASAGTGGTIAIKSGNSIVGTATVSNTGGWQIWQTVRTNVTLPKGKQILELDIAGGTSTFNLNSINIIPAAVITPATATTFCSGGNVILNANTGTGLTYKWLLNGGVVANALGASYTANATGSYKVIVSLAGIADTSAAVAVTVNTLPAAVITSSATHFCTGGSLLLTANSGAGLSYQWSNASGTIAGATAGTYSATTAGSYTVKVTNTNNCSTVSTALAVTVDAMPTAVITAPSTHFCTGGSLLLTANSGAGLSYQWSNASGTIAGATAGTYSATAAGSYTVKVTNANNCSTVSTVLAVTVDAMPAASITSPSTHFCTGGSLLLTANSGAGLSYQWSNASGTIAGATAGTYNATAAGSYTVKVINATNCSAVSAALVVTADALPTATITSPSMHFCSGGSLLLTANSGAGLSYQWSTVSGTIVGATAGTYEVTEAGTYTVKVSTSGNCSVTSQPVTVTVDAIPTVSDAGPDQRITTASAALAANDALVGTGMWTVVYGKGVLLNASSATSQLIGITEDSTVLSWTITNGSCASSTSRVTIYKNTAPASQTIQGLTTVTPYQTDVTYSVTSNKGSWYHWKLPSGASITSSNADSTLIVVSFGNTSGDVSVTETNAFGSTTSTLPVDVHGITTGITVSSSANYDVKPNPFTESISVAIKSVSGESVRILITDLSGRIAGDYVISAAGEYVVGEDLDTGMYVLTIFNSNTSKTYKIIKN